MAPPATTVIRDPVTNEVDYTFTEVDGSNFTRYRATATDFDLEDAYPWASYTVERGPGGYGYSIVNRAVAVMDDGRTVQQDFSYFYGLGGSPGHHYDTFTVTDGLGRLDSVTVIYKNTVPPSGHNSDFSYKALDYDPATGRLDYSHTTFWHGHTEAVDYDPVTGHKDYAYSIWPDGRTLSQDFDAQGRLDYVVERFADGRMTVTDYDVTDSHPWTSYSIAYDANGLIASTTVL